MPDWGGGWLWLVLVGAGIVVGVAFSLRVVGKRAERRRREGREQKWEWERQQAATKRAAQRSAEEACGLWCCWQNTKTQGAVYKLEEHDVPREEKEERERRQRPGFYGGVGGTVPIPGLLWLAQTDKHDGDTAAHYVFRGCVACERVMDAHIEGVTHDYLGAVRAFSDIGYDSLDGTVHMHTFKPARWG